MNQEIKGLAKNFFFLFFFCENLVSIGRMSVCNVIEKLMEHCIHCQPRLYTNDVKDLIQWQL